MRSGSFCALPLSLAALGCAAVPSLPQAPLLPDRGTAFVLENHLGWPYTLDRLAISVDGRPRYVSIEPRRGMVNQLDLGPGEHTVRLEVIASYPSGSVGTKCRTRFRMSKTLRVGGAEPAPAWITLDVYQRDLLRRFDERPDVAFRVHGASQGTLGQPMKIEPIEESCDMADPIAATLCRATVKVNRARRERDIVKLTCYSDKLAAMRATASVLERAHVVLDASLATEDVETGHANALAAMAEKRIGALWEELEQCVCEYPDWLAEDRLVFESGCTGTEPLFPEEED